MARSPSLVAVLLVTTLSACGGSEQSDSDASRSDHAEQPRARPAAELPRLEAVPPSGDGLPRGLACERDGYPCSWAEAPVDVLRASIDLGESILARVEEGSVEDGLAELESDPRVVEVVENERALGFRLEGGRRVWILPSDTLGLLGWGKGPTPSWDGSAVPADVASFPEVLGEDTDGNGRVNQRDRRRARVLDPFRWEQEEGRDWPDLAGIMERSDQYEVELLENADAGVDAFRGWDDFDVIHVTSHGHRLGILTGEVIDVSELDTAARTDAYRELQSVGIDLALTGVKKEKAASLKKEGKKAGGGIDIDDVVERAGYWSLGVTSDFFRHEYPRGLGRSIVVLNSCSSLSAPLIFPLVPENGSLSESPLIFGWSGLVGVGRALEAAERFWAYLFDDRMDAVDAFEQLRSVGLGRYEETGSQFLFHFTRAHRAVEIVTLMDTEGRRLEDGAELGRLMRGEPDDGRPDVIDVTARIDGIHGGDEYDERPFMEVWLELDGRKVGRSRGLVEEPVVDGVVTVEFENVPLGLDVEGGRTYELEAVVRLPEEEEEGGFSRYSVRLGSATVGWSLSIGGGPAGGEHSGTEGSVRIATRSGREGGREIAAGQIMRIGFRTEPGDPRVPVPGSCPVVLLLPRDDGVMPVTGTFMAQGTIAFADCEGDFGNMMDGTGYELMNGDTRAEAPAPVQVTIDEAGGQRIRGRFSGRFYQARDQANQNYIEYDRQFTVTGEFLLHREDWP